MPKNTHNENVGSKVERTDERIDQTGEVLHQQSYVNKWWMK